MNGHLTTHQALGFEIPTASAASPPAAVPNLLICLTQCTRYTKFRKLGQFEEWVVKGSQWQATRDARAAADGVRTAAGTWAVDEAEAKRIEAAVDGDEAWDRLLATKGEWTNKPVQPPGLGRCVWVPRWRWLICEGPKA